MNDGHLGSATRQLAFAVMGEGDIPEALAQISEATRSTGALLIATASGHPPLIVSTQSIDEPVQKYLAGDRPHDPRQSRVQVGPARGFAVDLEDFSMDEIRTDPYYADFLGSRGLRWHACAWVEGDGDREVVLSLKRSPRQGHFEQSEVERLDTQLGTLRTTFSLRRTLGTWRAGSAESVLERTDQGIAWLDRSGRLLSCSRLFEAVAKPVLHLSKKGLLARSSKQQAKLGAALAAVAGPQLRSAVVLSGEGGERILLRLTGVSDGLSEHFSDRSVLATAVELQNRKEPAPGSLDMVMQAFGLTLSEARVAGLVACGWSLTDCATRLAISSGTVRNHLKTTFAKTGVSRQTELAVLLGPMVTPGCVSP